MPRTIQVTILPPSPKKLAPIGSLAAAIDRRNRMEALDPQSPVLIVKRTDHPHFPGDYYYAIRESDKRLWTDGETVMTSDAITEAWYDAGCPEIM